MRKLLSLLGSVTLSGCMLEAQEESRNESFQFTVDGTPQIEVRSDDGPIDVRGTSGSEVTIRVYCRARGPSRRVAQEILESFQAEAHQDGRTVKLEVRSREARRREWGRAWAEVEIRTPRRANLRLQTRDGRIDVDGMQGTLELESGDGSLSIRDSEGDLKLRTADGSIQGSGLSGDLDASTSDGRIRLDGTFAGLRAVTSDGSIQVHCEEAMPLARDWLLRSSDGSIDLTLPRNASAQIEASTGDGRVRSDLDLTDARKSRDHVRGRLGDGGKVIVVKTSDGTIRLRSR